MNRSWRTTLASVITAVAAALAHFGIILSPDLQELIIVVGVVAVGYFARDNSVTSEQAGAGK